MVKTDNSLNSRLRFSREPSGERGATVYPARQSVCQTPAAQQKSRRIESPASKRLPPLHFTIVELPTAHRLLPTPNTDNTPA
jgi:hypothetical protein